MPVINADAWDSPFPLFSGILWTATAACADVFIAGLNSPLR